MLYHCLARPIFSGKVGQKVRLQLNESFEIYINACGLAKSWCLILPIDSVRYKQYFMSFCLFVCVCVCVCVRV